MGVNPYIIFFHSTKVIKYLLFLSCKFFGVNDKKLVNIIYVVKTTFINRKIAAKSKCQFGSMIIIMRV